MHMKKEQLFNRVSGMVDDGVSRLHSVADDLEEKFRDNRDDLTRRARKSWSYGKDKLATAEETMMSTVKEHPYMFLLAGLSILGLIIAKLMFDQREREEW